MNLSLQINGTSYDLQSSASETLLSALRRLGFHSIKFGDEHGLSGSDTILLDGKPVNAGLMLTAQAEGHKIATVEALAPYSPLTHLGEGPGKRSVSPLLEGEGPGVRSGLHPLQQAFIETGAIQCGYCTPAQLLAAKALLDSNPNPTEAEVREAIAGVLCRCTGYLKPVQAILRAAAVMRGEETGGQGVGDQGSGIQEIPVDLGPLSPDSLLPDSGSLTTMTRVAPKIVLAPETKPYQTVGKPEPKLDAVKLAQGKPAFTADLELRGMLHAKVLHSPHAHARIKRIDASKARLLPGVAAVLTWQDLPRVVYSTAGQSDPIPGPLDSFSLDNKVRFVGDRVAFAAAETRRSPRPQ